MYGKARLTIGVFLVLVLSLSTISFVVAFGNNMRSEVADNSGPVKLTSGNGESPSLAPNERWSVLDFGEGNIKQVTLTVATEGYVDVIGYVGGDDVESFRIWSNGVVSFSCWRIDFEAYLPSGLGVEKVISFDYTVTEFNPLSVFS